MKSTIFNPRNLGAIPFDDGTSFRVWAPNATSVSVVGDFNGWSAEAHSLELVKDGIWSGTVPSAKAGDSYQYEITNGERRFRKNDAYGRAIDGKTAISVIYGDTYSWKSPDIVLPPWNELVLYELHVGTFGAGRSKDPGRFDQVKARLPYLKNLGINAIALMPPMAFPSERSWGYNLTNPFAVEPSYGGPDELKRLIDAAHEMGIGVIMDVIINHFGPDNLDLWQYDGWSENNKGGIYFYNDQRAWTPWGDTRPDFGRGEVRQYLRDSVLLWLDQFHVDGIRTDATLFIRNTRGENNSPETDIPEGWTLMQWINDECRRYFPACIRIAEDLQQNDWLTKPTAKGGAGFDSQWDSAFVHPIRNAVTLIDDSKRSMEDVRRAMEFNYNQDYVQRIIYSESHDQVANGKARVPQEIDPGDAAGYYARKRSTLAAGLVFTTPGIPMLFEGQEFLEDGWFRDDKSLDWAKAQNYKGINRLYRDLINLRRNLFGNAKGLTGPFLKMYHVNDIAKVIAYRRWADGGAKDDVVVAASFSDHPFPGGYRIGFPTGGTWVIRFNSDWKGYSPDFQEVGNVDGQVVVEEKAYDGYEFSATVAIPAYGLVIFSQEEAPPQMDLDATDTTQ